MKITAVHAAFMCIAAAVVCAIIGAAISAGTAPAFFVASGGLTLLGIAVAIHLA